MAGPRGPAVPRVGSGSWVGFSSLELSLGESAQVFGIWVRFSVTVGP